MAEKQFRSENIRAALADGMSLEEMIKTASKYGSSLPEWVAHLATPVEPVGPKLKPIESLFEGYELPPQVRHIELYPEPDELTTGSLQRMQDARATSRLSRMPTGPRTRLNLLNNLLDKEPSQVQQLSANSVQRTIPGQPSLGHTPKLSGPLFLDKKLAEEYMQAFGGHSKYADSLKAGASKKPEVIIPEKAAEEMKAPTGLKSKASKLKGAAILTLAGMAAGSLGNQYMQPKPQYQDPLL